MPLKLPMATLPFSDWNTTLSPVPDSMSVRMTSAFAGTASAPITTAANKSFFMVFSRDARGGSSDCVAGVCAIHFFGHSLHPYLDCIHTILRDALDLEQPERQFGTNFGKGIGHQYVCRRHGPAGRVELARDIPAGVVRRITIYDPDKKGFLLRHRFVSIQNCIGYGPVRFVLLMRNGSLLRVILFFRLVKVPNTIFRPWN